MKWVRPLHIDTMEKELQSFKQENESKTTQLNMTMEDLNTTLVIILYSRNLMLIMLCYQIV